MIVHHFIYVFCKEAKDELLRRGYSLIGEDPKQNVYIFENKGENPFPDKSYAYILSDTLSL